MDPILKYKEYHKNHTNIIIHKFCVPLLLITAYAAFPKIALYANVFYTLNYIIFDVFSKKSIYLAGYLQVLYASSLLLKQVCSFNQLLIIHSFSWLLQILGHQIYERNTPAFIDNMYDSFLFAPYFIFLEIFYPTSFKKIEKYTIIRQENNKELPTIIYFAGLFQKSDNEYSMMSKQLPEYNHIFINFYFTQNDIFSDTLTKIIEKIEEFEVTNIECIVGYSFGGSLAKQFKDIYSTKTGKEINSVLISPGGFKSNTIFEKLVTFISPYLYFLYKNDKWYMISQYPIYQNYTKETTTDIFILSKEDSVHCPKIDNKSIVIRNINHAKMLYYVSKEQILLKLINSKYDTTMIKPRHVSSNMIKLIFGGHFYPYHVGLWTSVSMYYSYIHMYNNYSMLNLLYGFLFASTIWTFTEYMFHRYLLHNFFYIHHKKHHDFPNRQSIINTPMVLVVLNWFVYLTIFKYILSTPLQVSYYIFFPLNYLAFEYTHLLTHRYTGNNNIILNAKNFHRQHHFTPNTNYSFVTPFWDFLLGTINSEYSISYSELIFGFLPFYSFMLHSNSTFTKGTGVDKKS